MTVFSIFFILIIVLSGRTIIRNIDWQNEDNLWIATGKTSPSSPNTHNNLGDVYGRNGDLKRAEFEFKKAIEIKPNYADAYHNLGNTYRDMGKPGDALINYQKALSFNPKLWQSYQNIGAIYYEQKKYKEALDYIEKAIALNPLDLNLKAVPGVIYLGMGDKDNAQNIFLQVLKFDPQNRIANSGMREINKGK